MNEKFNDLVSQNKRLENEKYELENRIDEILQENHLTEKKIEEISSVNFTQFRNKQNMLHADKTKLTLIFRLTSAINKI